MTHDPPLPRLAWILGLAGVLPFAAAALALTTPEWRPPALVALRAYGAVILAFLGAVHWGLVLRATAADAPANAARLTLGIVPAFVGWIALLLPLPPALLLLAAAILATVVVETAAARHGLLPIAYLRLRWLLSTAAALCLLAGASILYS